MPPEIRRLLETWREAAAWELTEGSPEFGKGLDHAADELEAALLALPGDLPPPEARSKKVDDDDQARVDLPALSEPAGSTAREQPDGSLLEQLHTAIRSPLFLEFLRRGFWDANKVDLVWRHSGRDVREQADWLKDVWYLLKDAPEGTRVAVEVSHETKRTIVGGTGRTDDDPVPSSVRPHQHEKLQQRADYEADGRGGVSDDGLVVEQGEGGRSRGVSDVCAQSPTAQGNYLTESGATTDAIAVDPPAEGRERGLRATKDLDLADPLIPPPVEPDVEQAIEDIRQSLDWLCDHANGHQVAPRKDIAVQRAMAVHALNRLRRYARATPPAPQDARGRAQLVEQWRQHADTAGRLARQYQGDSSGNSHAFLKERRIWNTCADQLEAAFRLPPEGE